MPDAKIINYLTIKVYIYLSIIDAVILNIFPRSNYEPIYVCGKPVIKFRTTKTIVF